MKRFLRLLGCFLLLGAILGSGTAHAVPEVTAVRIGDQAPGTRVVLDLSEPVTYRLFTLENPHRVVLDLPELAWSASDARSEEHQSELQSLMRISYAVFCLKKNNKQQTYTKVT